jgi:serine/threonine protein kinase
MADLTGRRLGPYDLTRKLGQGGMGAVYIGIHRVLQTPRAIKVLLPNEVDEAVVERFVREGVISASLRHPNIVEIFDVGEDDGSHFLVMELVDGQSLHQLLREAGALPLDRVVRLLRLVADALDYAHARSVVHRDVKPSNIIVGPDDGVTLIDFGIARALDESRLTRAGVVVGTFEYMAPEMVTAGDGGPSADRYALGIVAYQMLTGRVPFSGTSPHSVMYRLVHDPPPPPTQFRPDLPAPFEQALLRQLAKSPNDRYPTSRAFVDALEAAVRQADTAGPQTEGLTGVTRLGFERPTPGSGQTRMPQPVPVPRPATAATLTPPAARALPTTPTPIPSAPTARAPRPPAPLSSTTLPPAPNPNTSRAQDGGVPVVTRAVAKPLKSARRGPTVAGLLVAVASLVALAVIGVYVNEARREQPIASVPASTSAATAAPELAAALATTVPAGPSGSAIQPGAAAQAQAVPPVVPTTTVPAVQQPQTSAPPTTAAAPPTAIAPPTVPPTAAVPPTFTPARRIEQARDDSALGQHAQALVALDDIRAAAPGTPGLDDAAFDVHVTYAKALFERGELDASDAQFVAALKLRPNDAAARDGQRQILLAKSYAAMDLAWGKDDEAAIAVLSEIMTVDPDYRETRQKLYALLIAKADRQTAAGERDAAFETLTQALGVLPDAGEAQRRLAAYTPTPAPEPVRPAPVQAQPAQQQPAPARKPAPAPAYSNGSSTGGSSTGSGGGTNRSNCPGGVCP